MEPKTNIKQHDFISGKPRTWFTFEAYHQHTNPCGEILLADWQEAILRHIGEEPIGRLAMNISSSGGGETK